MRLKELKRELKMALGNREDLDSRLTQYINLAQTRLARSYDFSEMMRDWLTTLSLTQDKDTDRRIKVPQDLKHIQSVFVLDGASSLNLEYISPRKWDFAIALHEQLLTGKPANYTMLGKEILLWRVPETNYDVKVRYSAWPKELVREDDETDFDHKDDLILLLAQIWAFQSLGETERANHAFSIFRGLLEDAIRTDESFSDQKISIDGGFTPASGKYWADPFYKG